MLEHPISLRWSDVDAYQHVNNARYLTYLEEGRDRWYEETVASVEGATDFVLVRVAIDFRRELTLQDTELLVKVRPIKLGRSSVTTSEEVWSVTRNFLAAEAESVMVAHDPQARTSRKLSPAERDALEIAIAAG
ncbi:MAG: thioesterase family protein [Actinomycetota bacterium]